MVKSFGGFGVDRVLDLHFVKEEGRLIMGGLFTILLMSAIRDLNLLVVLEFC